MQWHVHVYGMVCACLWQHVRACACLCVHVHACQLSCLECMHCQCMCVCLCLCMCAACACMCACVCVLVCMCTCVYVCLCVRHLCTYVCPCVCTCVCACVCVCVYLWLTSPWHQPSLASGASQRFWGRPRSAPYARHLCLPRIQYTQTSHVSVCDISHTPPIHTILPSLLLSLPPYTLRVPLVHDIVTKYRQQSVSSQGTIKVCECVCVRVCMCIHVCVHESVVCTDTHRTGDTEADHSDQ